MTDDSDQHSMNSALFVHTASQGHSNYLAGGFASDDNEAEKSHSEKAGGGMNNIASSTQIQPPASSNLPTTPPQDNTVLTTEDLDNKHEGGQGVEGHKLVVKKKRGIDREWNCLMDLHRAEGGPEELPLKRKRTQAMSTYTFGIEVLGAPA